MTSKELKTTIIEPDTTALSSVIWLHGLGATGHDFVDVLPMLVLKKGHAIRFVFPHAPSRPVSINAGMVMPAWYDIFALAVPMQEDSVGIKAANEQIDCLIEAEHAKGIPYENIIVMGFSQGGALALYSGLRFAKRLGGIAVLSSYLPLAQTLEGQISKSNAKTSIFMAHGYMDPVVPLAMGQHSFSHLQDVKCNAQWHAYPMAHMVCPQELVDLGNWMQDCLTNAATN